MMPQLGETVTEGTITRWMKGVGDAVERDEPLFEVSTDKVDSEVPSPAAGVLTEILVPEGETVEVGVRLAVIGDGSGDGGRTGAPARRAAAPPVQTRRRSRAPRPPRRAPRRRRRPRRRAASAAGPRLRQRPQTPAPAAGPAANGPEPTVLSPIVRQPPVGERHQRVRGHADRSGRTDHPRGRAAGRRRTPDRAAALPLAPPPPPPPPPPHRRAAGTAAPARPRR